MGFLGVLGWNVRRSDEPAAMATPQASAPAIAATSSIRAQQAESIVAANNVVSAKQAKAFTDDGWVLVDAPPPDPLLLSASPTLIGKRERELRWQLSSAPPDEKYLSNVVTIATDAHDAETRVAAVEAIARMGAGDPRFALVSVMKKLAKTDPARRALVPLLRPTSTTDALTIVIAALLDDSTVTPDERKTLAMTLAVVALHEGSPLPADVVESMTPAARALFDDAQRTAQAKAGS
ncbi:MAG: hypothetical protein ACXVEF_13525 [Polyangiales bacterium]